MNICSSKSICISNYSLTINLPRYMYWNKGCKYFENFWLASQNSFPKMPMNLNSNMWFICSSSHMCILAKKLMPHSPKLRVINLKFHEENNPTKFYLLKSNQFSDPWWTVTEVIKAKCRKIAVHYDMTWCFCRKTTQTGTKLLN